VSTLKQRVTKSSGNDDYQTPPGALDILYPYLPKEWRIWEPAQGTGNLVNALRQRGYDVIGTDKEYDFLTSPMPDGVNCIITNPPYSLKSEFVARCFVLGLPFALLMPLSALEGKERQVFYRQCGLQLIIPDKRFHFECPGGATVESNAWFATAWFCHGLNLSRDLLFVEIKPGRITNG
jgi:hypothetical protein